MDVNKAKRLITKIQSFLDHEPGQELSRLERDLLKSYIQQLYDAATDDQPASVQPKPSRPDVTFIETPPVYKPEPPKVEVPPIVAEIKAKEPEAIPMEIRYPEKETMSPEHKVEYKHVHVETPVKEKAETIFAPEKREPAYVPEKKETPAYRPVAKSYEEKGDLNTLFENFRGHDQYSHLPIDNIQAAMGLNERIFTLKELFGGDKALFDETCQRLNELHSFDAARTLLIHGVAYDHNWASVERMKMAEQFLRIVARRYPGA